MSILFFFLRIRRPPRSTRLTHSFPTRRSSDLQQVHASGQSRDGGTYPCAGAALRIFTRWTIRDGWLETLGSRQRLFHGFWQGRSEEHTSELQSLMRISYAVFCLKKKNTKKHTQYKITNMRHKYRKTIRY